MRIERVTIDGFGRLRDYDTGQESLPGLVVVLGPNEAGKSTLFHFLNTALYGFYPASRDNNPYVPWGTEEAGGGVSVRLDGTGCVAVERLLRSQPSGTLTVDGADEDLRNRSLPWVEHVPRQVFRQVFAVTLADLAGLDEETWGRVQDRILGSMGASDIVPARDVAAALEKEAGELWRPNRRGNQEIRDLQAEIRELRTRRRDALERDRSLRALVAERDAARERLQEARERRHRERVAVERAQALLPVRDQLARIAALREDAGPADELEELPEEPAARLAELEERLAGLEARREELAQEAVEPEKDVAAYGSEERKLTARADEVEGFVARASAASPERARLQRLKQEVGDLERRLETACEQLFSVPWQDLPLGPVAALSTREAREGLERFQSAREDRRVREAAVRQETVAGGPSAPPVPPALGLAVSVLGAALLAVGLSTDGALATLATALGGAGAAVGLVFVGVWLRHRRRMAEAGIDPEERVARRTRDARQAEEDARGALAELLRDVAVRPGVLEEPTELLVAGLERIQELLRDRRERREELGRIQTRVTEVDRDARTLAAALELDPGLDPDETAHLLDRELRRAERLEEAAASAERELRRLRRESRRVEEEQAEVSGELAALRDRLSALGGGDVERGLRAATERLQARLRADELRDELERRHPDLDEIEGQIEEARRKEESWAMDDDDLARRKALIEELGEEAERLAQQAEGLDKDVGHLREKETVDAIDSEIATLQDEADRLVRERDRKWVMAQVVREADRAFREEHQPDLIRRAGSYLERLTDGRYEGMVVDETADGDIFHLVGSSLPGPLPLTPPISTGTLEQAYLSLRLAIVDHLDQGGERLPVFIDEVFVNWDADRRSRGMEVLEEVSETRQVFVFTCHPEMASELADRGARVLELADVDGPGT